MGLDLLGSPAARRLLAAGAAVVCTWIAADSGTDAAEVETATRAALAFEVNGAPIRGLYPGAAQRTQVAITNPYPHAIRVHRVEANLAATSTWRCKPTAANLTVGSYRGGLPLMVPAHGRKSAGEFEVRMPNTVANACQKAEFRLVFTAEASRVGR